MLVCPEPAPLLYAVLDLADAAAENDLPRLRIGVAFGSAVARGSDWFGSPVNLASRVAAAAPPGTVLVAESVRDAIGNALGIEWTSTLLQRLKGVSGEVKLFGARRTS